ncbi:MAG: cobalamin B12-binding domain-containing protein [Deltaproteobacteria bacterium]|nr:cobalamin B12-binding domain-containing protein [Deltaproteobacteria bacterium]
MTRPAPRVLLVSPGCSFAADGSFGVPHLVSLGSYLRAHTAADVQILDLDWENRLPTPQPQQVFGRQWDVVGLSCYSSFDYLKTYHLGVAIRQRNPGVCLVVGGYHPSARPGDFTGEDSPFDNVAVGEGERPLLRIVQAVAAGGRLAERVLGPEIVQKLDDLPRQDWSLLARYLPAARAARAQVTFSLSRGCPFHCAFCMESAKQSPGWRAFSPERAEEELRALHAAVDLTDRPLFLCDPLFGLQPAWRREMLARLHRMRLPVAKFWALSRVDLLSDADLQQFHNAGFGLGFGLESGDPAMLAVVHKSHDAGDYLQRFGQAIQVAGRLGLPWGANLIAGHPGETEASLHTSAAYIRDLLQQDWAHTGFVSVDPYRFYPGSPIDLNLADFAQRYGTKVHCPRWWDGADPAFTAAWVDPSRTLDFRTCQRLTHQLFGPLVRKAQQEFRYRGPAHAWFARSLDHQVRLFSGPAQLQTIRDFHLWRRLLGHPAADARRDAEAAELLRDQRRALAERLQVAHGASDLLRDAVVSVPREQFVAADYLPWAGLDRALPLLADHSATLSAPHAYILNYTLLGLAPGDRLLELGTGTGYGAALAAHVVGETGQVRTVEAEPRLAAAARRNLAHLPQVQVLQAQVDFAKLAHGIDKVLFTFALAEPPRALLDGLPVGAVVVAPLGQAEQILTRWQRDAAGWHVSEHGPVRYVADRSAAPTSAVLASSSKALAPSSKPPAATQPRTSAT